MGRKLGKGFFSFLGGGGGGSKFLFFHSFFEVTILHTSDCRFSFTDAGQCF